MNSILIPVSIGELFDKASILQIKIERIKDESKITDCKNELDKISTFFMPLYEKNQELFSKLKKVNEALWEIEDDIRRKEKAKEFDDQFVQLARSVYQVNDKRSQVKAEINLFFGSDINEVKSYEDYN